MEKIREPFVVHRSDNQLELLYIESWMKRFPDLSVGLSSRNGGGDKQEMSSLNCALHVGDDPVHVVGNRKKLADALHISFDAWTCAEQVHGREVMAITQVERGMGKESRESAIPAKDALVTNEKNILLTAFFADCVPLYFYDPVQQAVGLAHAGWKGTVLNVAGAAVEAMKTHYGSRAEHIWAAIGPAIGMCCYEVDDAVIRNIPYKQAYKLKGNGKYMLDLKQLNRQFMIKAGILTTHIEISGLCTSCSTDLFFSHRKERGKTGRMVSWIVLKDGESTD